MVLHFRTKVSQSILGILGLPGLPPRGQHEICIEVVPEISSFMPILLRSNLGRVTSKDNSDSLNETLISFSFSLFR